MEKFKEVGKRRVLLCASSKHSPSPIFKIDIYNYPRTALVRLPLSSTYTEESDILITSAPEFADRTHILSKLISSDGADG